MRWKSHTFWRRLSETAPVASIALVLLLPVWLRHDPSAAEVYGPDPQVVAEASERTPYSIGRWVGQDADVPESAVRMLRPNVLLGRRFVDLDSGMSISFFLVHCGDARDMLGHYPPVCYPNAGWVLNEPEQSNKKKGSSDSTLIELKVNGTTVRARSYEFSRIQDWSTQANMRVFNFFILPDGSTADDIRAVHDRTNWLGASIQGVAQVQLVTSRDVPLEQAILGSDEILEGMSELFFALGVTSDEERDE